MKRCLAAMWLSGCGMSNGDIRAEFNLITSDGANLELRTYLSTAEDRDFVDFGDNAQQTVTVHGTTYTSNTFNIVIALDQPLVAEDVVTIGLRRDGGAQTTSTIAVPGALDVAPFGLFVPRSKDWIVSWQPITSDPMYWAVGGCLKTPTTPAKDSLADKGSLTFAKNTLMTYSFSGTCTASLTLTRRRFAPVDPAFADGSVIFHNEVEFDFASTP
jgi:hypothetical protein